MSPLAELLKEGNPELYNSFLQLLKHLEQAILPVLGRKGESLNSLPHLRNNENYLCGILPTDKSLFDSNNNLYLTPCELYVLLASVYLHDIGRINSGKGHGSETRKMLDKYLLMVELGIPSVELKNAIGKVCEIHEPEEIKKNKNPEIDFYKNEKGLVVKLLDDNKVIEEYRDLNYPPLMLDNNHGFIRINELGSLLSLVDNMDASYKRLAKLDVLSADNYSQPVSLFRNCIRSVSYNRDSQAIFVAIDLNGEFIDRNTEKWEIKFKNKNKKDREIDEEIKKKINRTSNKFESFNKKTENGLLKKNNKKIMTLEWMLINGFFLDNYWIPICKKNKVLEFYYKKLSIKALEKFSIEERKNKEEEIFKKDYNRKKIIIDGDEIFINKNNLNDTEIEFKEIIGTQEFAKIKEEIKSIKYPRDIIMSMILGNIRSSHVSMKKKYTHLLRLGVPVKCWLIYNEGHLYNYLGEETFEPVLTKDFLLHTLDTMVKLSTQVFGKSYFTYEMLASAAVERDITLIKLAVKRIAIISKKENKAFISFDNKGWRFESLPKRQKIKDRKEEVNDIINSLSEPF